MPRVPTAEPAVTRDIAGKLQVRAWDRKIGGLAQRQYGVVARVQLVELGLSEGAIDDRLKLGRLHRIHRGVYSVGHRVIPQEGMWLAAVLASGPGAVLSHNSAAGLWGIQRCDARKRIDVAISSSSRSTPRVRRRQVELRTDEVTARRRIPVTTLTRTIFDISAETSVEGLEATIRQAEYLHRFRLDHLRRMLQRHSGRRGATTVKACLARLASGPHGRRRSTLEDRFASLLADTNLPKPVLNAILDLDGEKIEVDCLWREQRLIVELDGGDAHGTRVAFESDRERDRRLQTAGWRVIRVTWRQLDNPRALLADLSRLLNRSNLQ